MNFKETKHTSKVTFKILPMDSCSQATRSSFTTVVFFFCRPRAGRGEGAVGAWEAAETEGRGIGLGLSVAGGGAAGDAEDGLAGGAEDPEGAEDGVAGGAEDGVAEGVEDVEEDGPAICCSFASLFQRI